MKRGPAPSFLCLYLPEFAAQARLRPRPAMRSKPVAILDGVPPTQTVCSSTAEARAMGILHGTTRAELDSYSGVHMLHRCQAEEQSAAAALLAMLWTMSPRVQVLQAREGAHRVVLDIAGTERIFGDAMQLAHSVLKQANVLGLTVRAAASENFHTAVCAARYAGALPQVIARGQEQQALDPLPLDALDTLAANQHDLFTLWGLHTLGGVAALAEAELVARVGQAGHQLHLLASGRHPHLFRPEEEHVTFEERISFDAPVEMLESLLFVLKPMLDQLVQRTESHARAVARISIHMELTHHAAADVAVAQPGQSCTRTVKPALPLVDSHVLMKLLQLELQAHPPGAPVVSICLEAEPGDPARAQLGLFSPQLPEPSRLDVTIARIHALVGEANAGRPRLLDTLQPERFVLERFTVPEQSRRMPATKQASLLFENNCQLIEERATQGGLALTRLRPSVQLPLKVIDAKPNRFQWHNVHYTVQSAHGPWRGSGSWWSEDAWSHEEWDLTAAAEHGATLVCRVAHDLLHGCWTLEGLYD